MADFSKKFAPQTPEDVAQLVVESPLGWIASQHAEQAFASVLPFRAELGADGQIVALRGHFARANPQLAALRTDPRALILILGPHSYISPSWMGDRSQAPTWNYASAWFAVELSFFEDLKSLRALLDELVTAMEEGRPNSWATADMGARFDRLAAGIVGFDARVVGAGARFKLGQDERRDVYGDIVKGLKDQGARALLSWMTSFNSERE